MASPLGRSLGRAPRLGGPRADRGRRWLARPGRAALLVLALAAFILDAGSVPHVHLGGEVALYNQEHDLGYLATFGTGGPLPAGVASAAPVAVVAAAVAGSVRQPPSAPPRGADSRAPPLPRS